MLDDFFIQFKILLPSRFVKVPIFKDRITRPNLTPGIARQSFISGMRILVKHL